MIDLREDGLAQLQFANQLGSQIGGTIAGIYNIKQKKLQQFRDEETQKAVVNIASDPNITSAQALQKLKGIKDAVNVKLTEYDKMLIQQAEYIRQQNAAIAPQVKSQMFDAARGMDFNGLTPDMMAQERRGNDEANAYSQLDRASGYQVPELAQMGQQPIGQPLDGRINDVFGRPLQGTTQDTFGGLTNTFNAGVASGKEQLSKPQGKYGTMPWWMHPDYKDTPEGQAAMQAATRIPGTSTGTRGGGTTTTGTGEAQTQVYTKPSDIKSVKGIIEDIEAKLKIATTPEEFEELQKRRMDAYASINEKPYTPAFSADIADDVFNNNFIGDGDKSKGIGSGWGRATAGETQRAFDKTVTQLRASGATWQQANELAIKKYDDLAKKDAWYKDSRLPEGKTGKDFVRTPPVNMPPEQPAQEQPPYTTGSGNNQSGTQGVAGNGLSPEQLEAQRLEAKLTGKPQTGTGSLKNSVFGNANKETDVLTSFLNSKKQPAVSKNSEYETKAQELYNETIGSLPFDASYADIKKQEERYKRGAENIDIPESIYGKVYKASKAKKDAITTNRQKSIEEAPPEVFEAAYNMYLESDEDPKSGQMSYERFIKKVATDKKFKEKFLMPIWGGSFLGIGGNSDAWKSKTDADKKLTQELEKAMIRETANRISSGLGL